MTFSLILQTMSIWKSKHKVNDTLGASVDKIRNYGTIVMLRK